MSQHDFNIANQTFPNFRADLNNALVAAATMSAGSSAPTTPYAYQLWFDTTTSTWKVRNSGNTAWISTITTDLATGNLDVTGTIKAKGGSISTQTTNAGLIANSSGKFVVNHGNEYGLYTGYINSTNDAIGIASTTNAGTAGPLVLQPFSGNVGIGVSDPSQDIDLVGSSNSGSGSVRAGGASSGTQAAFIAQAQFGSASFGTYANYPAVLNSLNNPMVYFNTNASGRAVFAEGITFNGDTAQANALDDYEEGTWTATHGGNNMTISNGNPSYVKIGRLVTVCADVTSASGSSTTNTIGGLPFAPVYPHGTADVSYVTGSSGAAGGYISTSPYAINFTQNGGTSGANISAGDRIIFKAIYYTDA